MKIIASDYDGTLHHHIGVSPEDRAAIKKWREAGNLFGIVTGRENSMLKTVVDEALEIDFVSTYNGAEVYDLAQGIDKPQLIARLSNTTHQMEDMLKLVLPQEKDWAEVVTPGRTFYFTHGDIPDASRPNWSPLAAAKDIREFLQIYALYDSEDRAFQVAKAIEDQYGHLVSPLINWHWVNATPAGVNKASGAWAYAQHKNISRENIYAVGDSFNDFDMIKAYKGYVMKNAGSAWDTLRAVAVGECARVCELIEIEMGK